MFERFMVRSPNRHAIYFYPIVSEYAYKDDIKNEM